VSALTPFRRGLKTTKARLETRASEEFSNWRAIGQTLLLDLVTGFTTRSATDEFAAFSTTPGLLVQLGFGSRTVDHDLLRK